MARWCFTCYRNKLNETWQSCDASCPIFGKGIDELAKIVLGIDMLIKSDK